MRGFDSCYPCLMSLELSNVKNLKRKVSVRYRKKRRSIFLKRTTNLINIIRKKQSGIRLPLSNSLAYSTLRASNFFMKFPLRSAHKKQTNKASSLTSISRSRNIDVNAKATGPDLYGGSTAIFSSKIIESKPNTFINLSRLLLISSSIYMLTNSPTSLVRGSVYKISLLALVGTNQHNYNGNSLDLVGTGVVSRTVQEHDFSWVSDMVLIRFFSKSSNLIRSSRRLSMSKIMRNAVLFGSKLSVDTYALNYFSYKLFKPASSADYSMVNYVVSVHLRNNLSTFVGLYRSSVLNIPSKALNTTSPRFLLMKKKPRAYARRYSRRLRMRSRSLLRSCYGNRFKKSNLLNKIQRKRFRYIPRIRTVFSSLQSTRAHRSRFASHNSPLLFSYENRKVAIANSDSSHRVASNYVYDLIGKSSSLPSNEFSHQLLLQYLYSPFLMKLKLSKSEATPRNLIRSFDLNSYDATNIYPTAAFTKRITKKVKTFVTSSIMKLNLTPWYHNTIIRFFEHCSGNKVLLQYYLSIANRVDVDSIVLYKRWIPRMASYERKLGHRFFMEEALHIMHLSFRLHDVSLVSSWLKAIIKRISFWKTRSIFRFLKYLFNNYMEDSFNYLGIKGFKIRLKGKISAAGNSRKRNIIFRSGKTSYSSVNLKCLHKFSTISTFTGVMGFQVWVFY